MFMLGAAAKPPSPSTFLDITQTLLVVGQGEGYCNQVPAWRGVLLSLTWWRNDCRVGGISTGWIVTTSIQS